MEILTDIATKIGFDWKLSVTHLINFLIIFLLLVKYALPAIKKVVEERTLKIKEGLTLRNEADKIVENAKLSSKEITFTATQKASEIISKSEASAKNIISESTEKASEIIKDATSLKDNAKNQGLKEAENILTKDISKILSKISDVAFSGKVTTENNNDFVSKVFKQNYSN